MQRSPVSSGEAALIPRPWGFRGVFCLYATAVGPKSFPRNRLAPAPAFWPGRKPRKKTNRS
jgi:hypothetical protein